MDQTKRDDPDLTPLLDTLWDIAAYRAVAKRVASGSSLDRRAGSPTTPDSHKKEAGCAKPASMSDVHRPSDEVEACASSPF